jgi:uncharacterized protein YegL
MGLNDIICEYQRHVLTIFFVIETSEGMNGINIAAVNSAVEKIISDFKNNQIDEYTDTQMKIAMLTYSDDAKWHTPKPVDIENFNYKHLEAAGLANLGEACDALNEKLSRKEFMDALSGCYAPIVILISYREPTDDYITKIKILKNNNWFKYALKAAVIIASDAREDFLADFTGSSKAILKIEKFYDISIQSFRSNFEKSLQFLTIESIKTSLCNYNVVSDDISPKQTMLNEKIVNFMNTQLSVI